jgi:glycine cleavage system transcriptional repressor
MPQLIISAMGPDRPGLVGEFTGLLFSSRANLADSRMVNLRGQFALVMLVEGSDDALRTIRAGLPNEAQRMGLTVTFGGEGAAPRTSPGMSFKLKTYSMDQPGIVHRITDLLRRHQINIEELETRLESAPFMGSPIFTMELRMIVPQTARVNTLRKDLEGICDQLNCDYDLEPA